MTEPTEERGIDEEPKPARPPDRFERITGLGTSVGRSLVLPTLALLSALIVAGLIIALSDVQAWELMGTDAGAAISRMAAGAGDAYKALFVGSLGSVNAISESLFAATPLILTGLAVALGFRAGLFNIGANGQMLIGAMAGLWVGLHLTMPKLLHIPVALLAAAVGGAIWGGIAGLLKAKTGAHEVITTIMLNFIALFLVEWLLKTPALQQPGRNNPQSAPLAPSATLPGLLGSSYRLTIGFLVALAAVALLYWILFRSKLGFEFRAVGLNVHAARYAGMNPVVLYVAVMAISGGLAGIAGANQIMGLPPYQASPGLAGTVGFDAIGLALLGRSNPVGVLWAGLLFGALRAGGREMQGAAGIPLDIVLVMQALIIVFIAAPELVRTIYRIKTPAEEVPGQLTQGWGA